MSIEWKYPWPKPISMYDSDGPREKPLSYEPVDFDIADGLNTIQLRITATKDEGIHSGRIRYKVECLTCGSLIHKGTTGPSSMFDDHLNVRHGMRPPRWDAAVAPLPLEHTSGAAGVLAALGLVEPAPPADGSSQTVAPSTPATPYPKAERPKYGLMKDDNWEALLECTQPGVTHLVLEIDRQRVARLPIENILQAHISVDPGADAGREREIRMLRNKAGDWESKYLDKQVDTLRLGQLESEVAAAKAARAAAESELAHLRQTIQPLGDPMLAAQHRVLLQAARAYVERCMRCGGVISRMPCPVCGVFRALLEGMGPHEVRSESRDLLEARAEMYNAEFNRRRTSPTSASAEDVAKKYFPQGLVFLLHPGVCGDPPYWELGSDVDPTVQALRRGELHKVDLTTGQHDDPIPNGWAPGRYLSLVKPLLSGELDWAEITEMVTINLEEGLKPCPEWLRAQYRDLATSRR